MVCLATFKLDGTSTVFSSGIQTIGAKKSKMPLEKVLCFDSLRLRDQNSLKSFVLTLGLWLVPEFVRQWRWKKYSLRPLWKKSFFTFLQYVYYILSWICACPPFSVLSSASGGSLLRRAGQEWWRKTLSFSDWSSAVAEKSTFPDFFLYHRQSEIPFSAPINPWLSLRTTTKKMHSFTENKCSFRRKKNAFRQRRILSSKFERNLFLEI